MYGESEVKVQELFYKVTNNCINTALCYLSKFVYEIYNSSNFYISSDAVIYFLSEYLN